MAGVALVTGGSSGIGRAVCESMLEAGHDVIALDRAPATIAHPRLHAITADLTDAAATEDAARQAAAHGPTTFIHVAGLVRAALLPDVTRADLDALSALHLGAAVTLAQAVLPAMRAARFGRIVLVSSRAALGLATRSAYSATKAGMIGLARTWALELAPEGITANCVAPGPIAQTGVFHEVLPEGDPRIEQLARGIPVRRLGTPTDVARTVMFLAAPEAGFITGQTLFVCGGTSVGSLTI